MIEEVGNVICNWSSWLVSIWEETSPTSHYTFSSEINKIKTTKIQPLKCWVCPESIACWQAGLHVPWLQSGIAKAPELQLMTRWYVFFSCCPCSFFFPSELRTVLGHFILVVSSFFLYCLQKSSSSLENKLFLRHWGAAIKHDGIVSTSISSPAVSDPRSFVSLRSFLTIDMII